MVWIAGTTFNNSTPNTVSFGSIPQTFAHLQVRISASALSSGPDNITIYGFDGTGGSSNSAVHTLYANGSSPFSGAATGQYNPALTQIPGTTLSSARGSVVVDILDYTSTNKYKVVRSIGGYDGNGSGYLGFTSVLAFGFGSSTALSNLWFYCANNYSNGSRFDLYGITTSSATGA